MEEQTELNDNEKNLLSMFLKLELDFHTFKEKSELNEKLLKEKLEDMKETIEILNNEIKFNRCCIEMLSNSFNIKKK